jgi:N-acetylneuraminic acid mutarotase
MFSRLKKPGKRAVSPVERLEGRQLLANVSQLVLVNADNGQLIGPFENNTTINYAALPANLSVRAFLNASAGSVRFGMDGTVNSHTENYDPYHLLGENSNGLPIAFHPSNGTHTMKVTAFSDRNGGGTAGETMNVTYNVGNAPSTPPAVVTGPTVTFSDNAADAKEAGLDMGTFVISRTGSTTSSLTVAYNVSGNATNGVDYQTLSGSITIPAGKSSVNLVITPKDDTLAEGTENIVLTLIAGASYNVGSASTATCPIIDNESGPTPPPTGGSAVVTFSDNTATAGEQGLDGGLLVLTRSGSTASALSVAYNVSGSATNGVDYEALSGMTTFEAGKSTATILITPKEDSAVEGTEHILISINPGAGYSLGATLNADVPILDNDSGGTNPPPTSGQTISDVTWTSSGVARSPEPRTEAGSIQIGSKIYAIGGFTATGGTGTFFPLTRKVHVYDMITKTWKQLASLPSSAAGNHFGVASDGQNIYVLGGQVENTYGKGTNTTWKYNIANNSWSQFVSLPEVRFGGGAFFVADGWLHMVGGDKADRETPTTTHWAIKLSNTSAGWQTRTPIPLAGDHMAHASVNGKVYILGGEHGHHGLGADDENGYIQHNYTFEYNPANDSWKRKSDKLVATSHLEGNTLVINGKIVMIGGLLTGGGNNMMSKVHVYDPEADKWTLLPTRYPKRILGSESGYLNGKIYIVDGYSPDSDDRSRGFEGTVKFV